MSDCIFCDIAAGQAPASLVYQDDITLAFMDIAPLNPGQVLVIPRGHAVYMADMDEATGGHLFQMAMRICQAVRKSNVKCEGINLFLADGEAAGQEVFHLHIIVIPRFKGDSFKVDADCSHPSRKELDDIAAGLRNAYQTLYRI